MQAAVANDGLTAAEISAAEGYLVKFGDTLAHSVSGLSLEDWDMKSSSGGWSISEIVEHVAIVEVRVHDILGRIAEASEEGTDHQRKEMDERIVAEIPVRTGRHATPEFLQPTGTYRKVEALRRFQAEREKTLELLRDPPCSLRGKVIPHPIFGPWDGYQWILGAAAHGARHAAQIFELRAERS